MKTANAALLDLLKKGDAVKAVPSVTADWNLNRYHDTRVTNVADEDIAAYDPELFPIESIVESNRPYKGINKARVGHGVVAAEYFDADGEQRSRFYIADHDDIYKYWTSPKPAVGGTLPLFNTTNFPTSTYPELTGHNSQTSVQPHVEYGTWDEDTFTAGIVRANKIVVRIENTWATPNSFDIVITRASGSQTVLSTQLTSGWEGTGEIVLRWTGTSWAHNGTLKTNDAGLPLTDTIKSVKLVVRTMREGYQFTREGEPLIVTKHYNESTNSWTSTNGSDSFFDLIEISAHLEADLSPWVISVSDTFELSDSSHLFPIGVITSNGGTLSLSNITDDGETGLFSANNDDPDVPWSDYIEANAQINLEYLYFNSLDEQVAKVRQFEMYTDAWAGQSTDTVSIDLMDYSKFLNQQTVPAALWEDLTVPELMWRVLDSVGFSNYKIHRNADRVTEHKIPIFYTNPEQTVWEVLDELARASQSAIYFDNNGVLQIKTRDFAFSAADEPVWTFNSEDTSDQLADIISLEQASVFEPNRVKVVYQKTNWSEFNRGQPSMQKVWEPETETVVLRAAPVKRDLHVGDSFFWIAPDEVIIWPYDGMVNIQGELISYEGKQYRYYTGPNDSDGVNVVVKSEDERKNVQREKAHQSYLHKSHFTGGIKITERGVWNSEPKTHLVNASGYSVRHIINDTHRTGVAGFRHLREESKVELNTGKNSDGYKDLLIATRGATDDTPFFYYGTRMMFVKDSAQTTQTAGMVIHNNGTNEDGYYIELSLSKNNVGNELVLYSRISGKNTPVGKCALAIQDDVEYEIDVSFAVVDGAHKISVWVNGRNCITETIQGATRNAANGKFGLFARGKTIAKYEYLYAIRRQEEELPDDFSYLDKIKRGYTGSQWDREWVYRMREVRTRIKKGFKREKYRFNQQFFDDFGPFAHEVREYKVKFDPNPVLHSRLYMTNDWSGCVLEYRADPFGARFYIANTQRHNAVIHGEDRLTYAGSGQGINQILTVLGRALVIDEAEEVIAENTDQIRARGKSESELTSTWIQSKAMAKDLADWIRNNFTYGNDHVSLEVFGNPLIEVADVVRVEHEEYGISGDYFVIAVNNSYEAGIITTVDLRRRV